MCFGQYVIHVFCFNKVVSITDVVHARVQALDNDQQHANTIAAAPYTLTSYTLTSYTFTSYTLTASSRSLTLPREYRGPY